MDDLELGLEDHIFIAKGLQIFIGLRAFCAIFICLLTVQKHAFRLNRDFKLSLEASVRVNDVVLLKYKLQNVTELKWQSRLQVQAAETSCLLHIATLLQQPRPR